MRIKREKKERERKEKRGKNQKGVGKKAGNKKSAAGGKERKERSICVLHVWRGEMIW